MKRSRSVPARQFHPSRPKFSELAPAVFLGLLLAFLARGLFAGPTAEYLVGWFGLAGLVAGGTWLILRLRWPGKPTLHIDARGLVYMRGKRERSMAWTDVTEIHVFHPHNEMRFFALSEQKPIVVHRDMLTADGQRFDVLVDDYWRPPAA